MSSVCQTIDCPQCKNEDCHYEMNCHSGYETVICADCGFSYNSKEGKKKGSGAYMLWYKDGIGQFGSLSRTFTFEKASKEVVKISKKLDLEKSYISKWDDKTKKIKKYYLKDLLK
jgi:hypothetical protein